jgi:hypothetical protein
VMLISLSATGSLNHAVQRDMFDDLQLSHSELPFLGLGEKSAIES